EAYLGGGDPSKYPEQIREGLGPWQAKKLYFTAGFGGRGGGRGEPTPAPDPKVKLVRPNKAMYDPLLGKTYAEIGSDARSNHKCQGTSGLPGLPGFANGRGGGGGGGTYQLMETSIAGEKDKDETSFFDGIDTSLSAIAAYAGANPPDGLKSGLAAIA